jgi:hypothetical protein
MIQGATSRTLDLELGELTHSGKKSLAMTASAFF